MHVCRAIRIEYMSMINQDLYEHTEAASNINVPYYTIVFRRIFLKTSAIDTCLTHIQTHSFQINPGMYDQI